MTSLELVTKDGHPRGTYLRDTLAQGAGRMTILYILTKLGYFACVSNTEEAAVRNASVRLLNDITAQTGFVLDVNLQSFVEP